MSCNNKWVKLIFDSEQTVNLTEIDGFDFIKYEKYQVEGETESVRRMGTDGSVPMLSTFNEFTFSLEFRYTGEDSMDAELFLQKLDRIMFRSLPYYVVHSVTPNKKYAVLPTPKISYEYITLRHRDIKIEFTCYKGYSESLYETDQFSLIDSKWQFESGLVPDNTIKYIHNRSLFDIYNGSHCYIDPRHDHKLKIRIQLATDTGFKLVNKVTGDVFEYKGALKANQSFVIDGGYAYKDEKRCGRQTNHGIIKLAPGYNTFEVWGKISNFEIEFIFPFIFR